MLHDPHFGGLSQTATTLVKGLRPLPDSLVLRTPQTIHVFLESHLRVGVSGLEDAARGK